MESYDRLIEKAKEMKILWSVFHTVFWDTLTMLPAGAVSLRGEQNSLLGKVEHRITTDKELERLLKELETDSKQDSLTGVQKRNVYLIRRDFDVLNKIPEALNAQYEKQKTITNHARERAKVEQNWSIFEPEFKKLIDLEFEACNYIMDTLGVTNPLDAEIDTRQEGMRVEYISKLFDEITKHIVPLVKKYSSKSEDIGTDVLNRKVDRDSQKKIIEKLAEILGYDFKSDKAVGRLGESMHPMTIGVYDDVRITLNYDENNFLYSFYAFIHECGHALYNINLNREWMFQPIGWSAGSAVHESQSQFLEKLIGRSPEFLKFMYPILNDYTNGLFAGISVKDFARAVNLVKPSKIRVNSDELTYNLHIIIRFEIEKALFAREIDVSEVPSVWNDLYEKYLGVEVEHDEEGALQDIHWGAGMFGTFPCYTLGSIFAAQLAKTMTDQIPDWKAQIGNGDFGNIIGWMADKVHRTGNLYDAPGLIRHITGKEISAKPYIQYLKEKYKGLYG
jgi:carboxypeptidase Taq